MFKKLKDKIAEDLKFSPQRLTQATEDKTQSPNNDENFFSIADDDATASTSTLDGGFTDVSLQASTPMEPRIRKHSNSSMASDISFLPRYEPPGNLYHMQSDLDVSASEIEDNASMSSQLGYISKEQVYSAFQKAQMRYHKYRGRYTDLANHYKLLEKENSKIKSVLVDTQDKAIRRINDLKEQCALEQKAKAHLENALRVELDEKQIKIDTLLTKIKFLQNGDKSDQLIDISKTAENSRSTSNSSLSDKQNEYAELTKYLNDARQEIENLNGKLQEMKANVIIFNTKEVEYKQKIQSLEKFLHDRNLEINQHNEREKENNLKLAQSKMELHAEIHNKDLEIANLKRDLEHLRQDFDKLEKSRTNVKLENLQSQNTKLINKIDTLNQKCFNYENELIKVEQYKIEIANLNEIVINLKKINDDLKVDFIGKVKELNSITAEFNDVKQQLENSKLKLFDSVQECESLKLELDSLKKTNENGNITQKLKEEIQWLNEEHANTLEKIREDARNKLLTLESKIKEKLNSEYEEKQKALKMEYDAKLQQLSRDDNRNDIKIKLIEIKDVVKKVEAEHSNLLSELNAQKDKYKELENNHLDLITESNQTRKNLSVIEKENSTQKNTIESLEGEVISIREELAKVVEDNLVLKQEILANTSTADDSLQKLMSEKTEENERIRSRINELEHELNLKISDYEVLQTEFSLLQVVSTKQQNDNCDLKRIFEDEYEKLSKQIEDLTKETITLKQEISHKVDEIDYSNEERDKLMKTNSNLQQTIDDLNKENARLSEDMEKLLEKNSSIVEKISKSGEENQKLKNEVKNFSLTIKNLQEQVSKTNNILKELEDQKNEFDVLSKELKKKNDALEDLKREKNNLLEEISKGKAEIDGLKKEKNDIFTRLMKMEKENELIKEEKAKIYKENETLIKTHQNKTQDALRQLESIKKEKLNAEQNYCAEINELKKVIEQLRQYEEKYQGILDENHNLKEQISKIEELKRKLENLESIEDNFQTTTKEKDTILKDLENMEKQKTEALSENKKLKQEMLDLKVLNEKLKNTDQENQKLLEEISNLRTQIRDAMTDNQNLMEEIARSQKLEMNYNNVMSEIDDLRHKTQQLSNENSELLERNQQLSLDYKQILEENEKHIRDYAELKIKYEGKEMEYDEFDGIKQRLMRELEELKKDLEQSKSELDRMENEKVNLEKLQSSTLENSESQTSSLKNKIKQLQGEKSDYESLLNEYKQMKTETNNVTQLYNKCLDEKKYVEGQLQELERHYNELAHEKQLLKDEIQELKISPLNFTTKHKLDDLEVLKGEMKYVNEENYLKEIDSLREKLEKYKSIDKANRSSIEFYENELQKLKVKNEKISRKLDDTLVTLPALAGSNDFGDSHAILEYLRNVLYNYMTGKESLVLAKVIAAVCKFDKEQTDLILQKEQQRQTLLGQLFGS